MTPERKEYIRSWARHLEKMNVGMLKTSCPYSAVILDLLSEIDLLEELISQAQENRDGWHRIVSECERILGYKDTSESPLTCNLSSGVRELFTLHAAMVGEKLRRITRDLFLTEENGRES